MGLQLVWDDLQFFLSVARNGQLSRAARQLRTSHVTVGRRIERLEQTLKMRLFERNPRGYVLTAAGERLLPMAEKLEQETGRLQEELAGPALHGGVLRLNLPEGFGSFFCTRLLGPFIQRFPAIALEVVSIQQIMSLSRKVADVAVLLDPPKAGPYWIEKITDYSLHLFASADYLARHPPIETREDLARHAFVGYIEEMIFAPGLDYMGDVYPGIRPRFQSSSIFSQLTATLEGLGIAVLPHYIASQFPDLRIVLPDDVRLTRHYWLVCHRDLREIPRERAVIDFLLNEVRGRSGLLLRS